MMRQKRAKKPLILGLKIKIANKVQHWESTNYSRHPRGFYWTGLYKLNNVLYSIYFQRYSRDIARVDYVSIRYREGWKALTPKELRSLAKFLRIDEQP